MQPHLKSQEGEEDHSPSTGNPHAAGQLSRPPYPPSEHYSGTTCHNLHCAKAGAGCIWSSFSK